MNLQMQYFLENGGVLLEKQLSGREGFSSSRPPMVEKSLRRKSSWLQQTTLMRIELSAVEGVEWFTEGNCRMEERSPSRRRR